MNKTIAITAIAMFAVVLAVSAFAPAFAVKQATAPVCHFGLDGDWHVLYVSTNGVGDKNPLTAHLKHGDSIINDGDFDETNDSQDCLDRNL